MRLVELLSNDASLTSLLGGSNKIYHKFPRIKAGYPCVVYDISDDIDVPYEEDRDFGDITRSVVVITVHDNQTSAELSEDIASRIKQILNNNAAYQIDNTSLTSSHIVCYSSVRTASSGPQFDTELEIWVTPMIYEIVWAPRDDINYNIIAKANIS